MKNRTMINLIAGATLAIGPVSVMASTGGWAHDPHTGTFYHTGLPMVERSLAAAETHAGDYKRNVEGGWAHDPVTGTFYNTNLPEVERGTAAAGAHLSSYRDDVEGGWAHDPVTGTFYHTRDM